MKPIKVTLFITAAVLFSMILASLKVQAQTEKHTPLQKLTCEIEYYHTHKVILKNLSKELSALKTSGTPQEKIQDIESSIQKSEISEGPQSLKYSECEEHLVDAEMELKGQTASSSVD